ncbi:MAG TPA: methyltransferase domain-containing protein [Stellaceae bacterium]|nr:methyltransferase domain-containing protein [Stellaceae bacterium]
MPSKSVIEIGAQQLNNGFLEASAALQSLGPLFGVDGLPSLPPPRPARIGQGGLALLDADAPPARIFWNWLGFDYAAIDIDGSPGAIPLDLNYDDVPSEAEGRYGLVTNFGTTEHVANQLNAFKIIHDLTALDGVMIHQLPAQGMFNHGLVNYNPKFFWMLARSNAYRFLFARYSQGQPYPLPENIVEFIASFEPEKRPSVASYAGADAGLLVVMQKTLAIPFVPPLDVQTGSHTEIESLKQRYWTVFDPEALASLQARAAAAKDDHASPSGDRPSSLGALLRAKFRSLM